MTNTVITPKLSETRYRSKHGRIYKKVNVKPDGSRVPHSTWTVRYKHKDYATGETNPQKAEKFLLKLIGDLASGRTAQPEPEAIETRVMMSAILDGVVADSEREGNATAQENAGRMSLHVRPFFDRIAAADLTSETFNRYITARLKDKAAPATINRELAMIKHGLKLAVDNDPPLILRFPKIKMLKVRNVRKGFLMPADYRKLKAALPSYLVPVLVAAYHTGTRRGELLQVELHDVELNAKPQPQFRLYPDATKNGEGRVIPIYGEMIEVFRRQIETTRRDHPNCTWLFNNGGEPIFTFYKAWASATKKAGMPDLLFHDLRRTAVRNLIRAGVSRKVAMDITGHKTEAVFERYNITDDSDLKAAAGLLTAYHATA